MFSRSKMGGLASTSQLDTTVPMELALLGAAVVGMSCAVFYIGFLWQVRGLAVAFHFSCLGSFLWRWGSRPSTWIFLLDLIPPPACRAGGGGP